MKSLDLDLEDVYRPLFLLLVCEQNSTQYSVSSSQKGLQLDQGPPRRRRQECRNSRRAGTPIVRSLSVLFYDTVTGAWLIPPLAQLYPDVPCIVFCSDNEGYSSDRELGLSLVGPR